MEQSFLEFLNTSANIMDILIGLAMLNVWGKQLKTDVVTTMHTAKIKEHDSLLQNLSNKIHEKIHG